MISRKRIATFSILILLVASIPLVLYNSQRQTKLKSAAHDFGGYNISCESQNPIIRVSDPTEFFDSESGTYTLQWTVKNLSDQTWKLHTETLSCRCTEPNAQEIPQELLDDPTFSFPGGRICVGGWPNATTTSPPTSAEILSPWNYCDYGYDADVEKLASDGTIAQQKANRAAATTRQQNGPLVLQAGEEKIIEWRNQTIGTTTPYCGSFQTTWRPLVVESADGNTSCTIESLLGENKEITGILLTGDGQVGENDYSDWRPEGIPASGAGIGQACKSSSPPPPPTSCEAMDVQISSNPLPGQICLQVLSAYYWNGSSCLSGAPTSCYECEGSDCDSLFDSQQECEEAFAQCGEPIGKRICDDAVCRICEGPECDELEKSECSTKTDCSATICVADNVCEAVSLDEVKRRVDNNELAILCNEGPDCNVKQICRSNACVLERGSLQEGDTPCTPENASEVCEESHFECENNACVKKSGDKEDTCNPSNPDACIPTGGPEHTECVGNSCTIVQSLGQNTCEKDKDCLQSYFTCKEFQCVEVIGEKPPGTEGCNSNIPNVCAPPPEPPETGISGGALAVTIIVALFAISGLALVW